MASGLLSDKVDPWAFIRVKDERTTLLTSLNSILPIIHKGVIAYNDCTDGSDEIVEQFCIDHPGFIPFNYPHHVEPAGSKKYETGELKEENTLAGYYNAALQLIPKNEWMIKIDVDQIYFPDILGHSFYLPKNTNDIVFYSRLNLLRDINNQLRVINYIRPGDHWLVFNDSLKFINIHGYYESGEFYAFEKLKMNRREVPFTPECSSVHFPCEKKYRRFRGDISTFVPFEEYLATADKCEFSDEIIKAKEMVKTFDFQ